MSTPNGSPGKLVPMQITPQRKTLKKQEEFLKENFFSTTHEGASQYQYFTGVLKNHQIDEKECGKILTHVTENWNNNFQSNPVEGICKISQLYVSKLNGTELIYTVPYIYKKFCVSFTPLEPFLNFIGAIGLSIWLGLSIKNIEDGFILYMSLDSPDGDRVTKDYFNWFSQELVDKKEKYSTWLQKVWFSDYVGIYIKNICMLEEYILFQLVPWLHDKTACGGFYDMCFKVVTQVKTAEILSHISTSGKLSTGDFLLLCVKRVIPLKPVDKIDTIYPLEENFMMGVIEEYQNDPFKRLDYLRSWEVAILVSLETRLMGTPKCMEERVVFLRFLLMHTFRSFPEWMSKS